MSHIHKSREDIQERSDTLCELIKEGGPLAKYLLSKSGQDYHDSPLYDCYLKLLDASIEVRAGRLNKNSEMEEHLINILTSMESVLQMDASGAKGTAKKHLQEFSKGRDFIKRISEHFIRSPRTGKLVVNIGDEETQHAFRQEVRRNASAAADLMMEYQPISNFICEDSYYKGSSLEECHNALNQLVEDIDAGKLNDQLALKDRLDECINAMDFVRALDFNDADEEVDLLVARFEECRNNIYTSFICIKVTDGLPPLPLKTENIKEAATDEQPGKWQVREILKKGFGTVKHASLYAACAYAVGHYILKFAAEDQAANIYAKDTCVKFCGFAALMYLAETMLMKNDKSNNR